MMHTPIPPQPRTLARWLDPGTSGDAAEQVGQFAQRHYVRILDAMGAQVLGASQIAGAAGLDGYQVRKRLPELERAGLVRVAEGRRRTPAGRSERLWVRAQGLPSAVLSPAQDSLPSAVCFSAGVGA